MENLMARDVNGYWLKLSGIDAARVSASFK